ncbi:histidine decarboxylase [Chryseobacterium tructae]|uniref:Histidine decarboxylase n=1 Tax=Chryseobacterium tructae TaxID=1037380 RepID=A0ABV7XSQ4_9FLAO|nr:histidine decarboxylase [Chryseobacterium tructae]MDN3691545.1 histidine decarboxylase [Chryseobacterium tructae]
MNKSLLPGDQIKIDQLEKHLEERNNYLLGYPSTIDFDYSLLYKFLKFPVNNAGDSFYSGGSHHMNTHSFEREVIGFFADLFKAPENNYWGYVTNGSSEGNLYALYLAKRLHPEGIVYFSEEAHYSVEKNIDILGLQHQKIKTQINGEIDYNDLKKKILINTEHPVIIVANIGTTLKEARDDIRKIQQILDKFNIKKRYIHCDAAFCGAYAQFLSPKPYFDFSEGADSIIVSGHKFIGSPIPCGVIIVLKHNKEKVSSYVDVLDSLDDTITGSRNAITPLLLWYSIKCLGAEGLRHRLEECLILTAYTLKKMTGIGINAWQNPNSLTILIPRVHKELQYKWQLATHGEFSHIIIRPGITKKMIDLLILDLKEGAYSNDPKEMK